MKDRLRHLDLRLRNLRGTRRERRSGGDLAKTLGAEQRKADRLASGVMEFWREDADAAPYVDSITRLSMRQSTLIVSLANQAARYRFHQLLRSGLERRTREAVKVGFTQIRTR